MNSYAVVFLVDGVIHFDIVQCDFLHTAVHFLEFNRSIAAKNIISVMLLPV